MQTFTKIHGIFKDVFENRLQIAKCIWSNCKKCDAMYQTRKRQNVCTTAQWEILEIFGVLQNPDFILLSAQKS